MSDIIRFPKSRRQSEGEIRELVFTQLDELGHPDGWRSMGHIVTLRDGTRKPYPLLTLPELRDYVAMLREQELAEQAKNDAEFDAFYNKIVRAAAAGDRDAIALLNHPEVRAAKAMRDAPHAG